MLPPLLDKNNFSPADKWLWAVVGVLVVGQLVAFWMLCRDQVNRAQARHASAQLARVAMADCIQTLPRTTRSDCATRVTIRPGASDFNAVMQALR
jgi:hypothetical protein